MNELERYNGQYDGPIYQERPAPRLISRRMYNLVLAGLIVLSFGVMGVCSTLTGTMQFMVWLGRNAFMFLMLTLAGTIGGLITMSIGRAKENLVLSAIGYILFSVTFGFTTSFALSMYSLESIQTAFTATAGIMVVFGMAGIAFPRVFERIIGVLCLALLAIVLMEVVLAFMGIQQSVTDIVVVLIFCGFIGYDVHRAATAEPTLSNALWFAIDLYLDIINVFLRLLQLFGNRE